MPDPFLRGFQDSEQFSHPDLEILGLVPLGFHDGIVGYRLLHTK